MSNDISELDIMNKREAERALARYRSSVPMKLSTQLGVGRSVAKHLERDGGAVRLMASNCQLEISFDEANAIAGHFGWYDFGFQKSTKTRSYTSLYAIDDDRGLAIIFNLSHRTNSRGDWRGQIHKGHYLVYRDSLGRLARIEIGNARSMMPEIRQNPESLAAGINGALRTVFGYTMKEASTVRCVHGLFVRDLRTHGLHTDTIFRDRSKLKERLGEAWTLHDEGFGETSIPFSTGNRVHINKGVTRLRNPGNSSGSLYGRHVAIASAVTNDELVWFNEPVEVRTPKNLDAKRDDELLIEDVREAHAEELLQTLKAAAA